MAAQHPLARELAAYAENGVILDTETTGLGSSDEVIEIAVIDTIGNILLNTTVKPSRPYGDDNEAAAVHGIRYNELLDAPSWPQVQEQLIDIAAERPILIYNADFDIRLMQQSAILHGIAIAEYRAGCMMKLYSQWYAARHREKPRRHRLIQAAADCGVRVTSAHRALADCLTTLGVFLYMLDNSNHLSIDHDYQARNRRTNTDANPHGHLYGHTVVFTGDLSRPRPEIQQIAADAGCRCTANVSPKTTILVLGATDLSVVKNGISSKERRARELQAAGHPIQILNEAEFMHLLGG